MKIALLTPGTGSYHCGVCMRDNALAREVIRQGHEALMLPMYLPLTLDEEPARTSEVFFGGINVYLQQKFAFFRHTPAWVDSMFNHPALLKAVGRFSGMTGGAEIGEMTHSMLLGESGQQAKEVQKLVDFFTTHERVDAVWLSTALLAGLARRLRGALRIPVICSLQGEDSFLDTLSEPWRSRCWDTLADRSTDIDAFVAPSRYFGDLMAGRMRIPGDRLHTIPNGISMEGYEPAAPANAPAIGYLARFIPGKGLGIVVDAFIRLRERGNFPQVRLRCAGTMVGGDERYLAEQKSRLERAGLLSEVDFLPNVSREEKIAFLQSLTLFSVPATYGEAFGLYLVEAAAAGVALVQPRHAGFPEVVEGIGGGVLYDPGRVDALVEAWETLLGNPEATRAMGQRARETVAREYTVARMAERFIALTREKVDAFGAAS